MKLNKLVMLFVGIFSVLAFFAISSSDVKAVGCADGMCVNFDWACDDWETCNTVTGCCNVLSCPAIGSVTCSNDAWCGSGKYCTSVFDWVATNHRCQGATHDGCVSCPAPLADCNYNGGCETHTDADWTNCGGCGVSYDCTLKASYCASGKLYDYTGPCNSGSCAAEDTGYTNACCTALGVGTPNACSDGCHDFQADWNNCGSCGNKCSTKPSYCSGGKLYDYTDPCSSGSCTVVDTGYTDACCSAGGGGSPNACSDGCRNFQVDWNNCGSCGNKCSTKPSYCSGGKLHDYTDPCNSGTCAETVSCTESCCDAQYGNPAAYCGGDGECHPPDTCRAEVADIDNDLFKSAALSCGTDCNDYDNSRWQSMTGYDDVDNDDYGTGSAVSICSGSSLPSGYVSVGGDCNDNRANIHPGAAEVCGNGVDEDCSGADAACLVCGNTIYEPANGEECDFGPSGRVDVNSRYCDPSTKAGIGICLGGLEYQDCLGTCKWGNWKGVCVGAVLPATETCNNLDDDCDGTVDENTCIAGSYCNGAAGCVQKSCGNNPAGCDTDMTEANKCDTNQAANCLQECKAGLKYDGITGKCITSTTCFNDNDCTATATCWASGLTIDSYCDIASHTCKQKVPLSFYCDDREFPSSPENGCCTQLKALSRCIDYDQNPSTGVSYWDPVVYGLEGSGYTCTDTQPRTTSFKIVNALGQESRFPLFMALGKPYTIKVRIEDDTGDFYRTAAAAGVNIGIQSLSGGWVGYNPITGGYFGEDMYEGIQLQVGSWCTCTRTWTDPRDRVTKCTAADCTFPVTITPPNVAPLWPSTVKIVTYTYDGRDWYTYN